MQVPGHRSPCPFLFNWCSYCRKPLHPSHSFKNWFQTVTELCLIILRNTDNLVAWTRLSTDLFVYALVVFLHHLLTFLHVDHLRRQYRIVRTSSLYILLMLWYFRLDSLRKFFAKTANRVNEPACLRIFAIVALVCVSASAVYPRSYTQQAD